MDSTKDAVTNKLLKWQSVEQMYKKGEEYFRWCADQEKPYTYHGMLKYLDISKASWKKYRDGSHDKYVNQLYMGMDFSNAADKLELKVLTYLEERLHGSRNVTGAIFALKNLAGWSDKQDVTSNGKEVNVPPMNITVSDKPK